MKSFSLQRITGPSGVKMLNASNFALKQIFKLEIGKGIGNLTVDGVFKPIRVAFYFIFGLVAD